MTVLGAATLVAAIFTSEQTRNWYQVASVNGVVLNRGELRARLTFENFLYQQQLKALSQAQIAGRISADEVASAQTALNESVGDPVLVARDGLVDDTLMVQLATQQRLSVPSQDRWAVLADFLEAAYARHLRWVSIASVGPASTPDALATEVGKAMQFLEGSTAIDSAAAALGGSAWQITGGDSWIGDEGPAAGIDDLLVAAAQREPAGTDIGPFTDRRGQTLVGIVSEMLPTNPAFPQTLADAARAANVDDGVVVAWAQAELDRLALERRLRLDWVTTPIAQVQIQELVVGPAEPAAAHPGPWVELAQLNLESVPADALAPAVPTGSARPSPLPAPSSSGGALASSGIPPPVGPIASQDAVVAWLRNRTPADRDAAFLDLAAATNLSIPSGVDRSGEIGFLARSDLTDAIGSVAFGPPPADGLIGPLTLDGQPRLFLIEARYDGSLDDRSKSALAEARQPAASLAALAALFAPGDAPLAIDGGWWSRAEFATSDTTGTALFGTSIGSLTDPVVLDNELALARPIATRTAIPDPISLARLDVDGFSVWFANQMAAATIVLATNPLPEAEPSGAASPSPSLPSAPALETPNLPSPPGLSSQGLGPPSFPGGGLITPPPLGLP